MPPHEATCIECDPDRNVATAGVTSTAGANCPADADGVTTDADGVTTDADGVTTDADIATATAMGNGRLDWMIGAPPPLWAPWNHIPPRPP